MSRSSSSQDLRNKRLLSSSSGTQKTSSKQRLNKDKGLQTQTVRIAVSLLNFSQLQSMPQYRQRPNSMSRLDMADACQEEPPVAEPFTVRKYNGKMVRDVLIDTHDLINEPGGFVMNLSYHGQETDPKEINIHLGIKEKRQFNTNKTSVEYVCPGTITTTDDYAREIFRKITCSPQLEFLTAILEINDEEDKQEEKLPPEMSSGFLHKFIQTYPTNITMFHVEMPGISPVYLPEWQFLLNQQMKLKHLICNFGVVLWDFYEDCILQNSNTLTRVILRRLQTYDFQNATYSPLNWKIFSECVNMEYLKVTCGYKNNTRYPVPQPPSSVFLHENLEDLPKHGTFTELHLGNVWVDRRDLDNLCTLRPNLKFCSPCNDLEYYDDGDKANDNVDLLRGVQFISFSKLNIDAEFSGSITPNATQTNFSREKELACVALTLFFVIIMAFAILFIVVYFRHLKSQSQVKNTKSVFNFIK